MTDESSVQEISTWEEMTPWLGTFFADQPVGVIIDLGQSDYVEYFADEEFGDEAAEVVCAGHVLSDGVLMVRRSRTMRLRLDDHFDDDCAGLFLHKRHRTGSR